MQPNHMCLEVDIRRHKMACIECDPKREWRDEKAIARGVEDGYVNSALVFRDVSSEANPSHRIVLRDICACICCVAKEVGAVVSGIRIKSHHVRKRVKRRRSESLLIDIGERSHHTSIADTEEIKIVRMIAVFLEQRNRIEP